MCGGRAGGASGCSSVGPGDSKASSSRRGAAPCEFGCLAASASSPQQQQGSQDPGQTMRGECVDRGQAGKQAVLAACQPAVGSPEPATTTHLSEGEVPYLQEQQQQHPPPWLLPQQQHSPQQQPQQQMEAVLLPPSQTQPSVPHHAAQPLLAVLQGDLRLDMHKVRQEARRVLAGSVHSQAGIAAGVGRAPSRGARTGQGWKVVHSTRGDSVGAGSAGLCTHWGRGDWLAHASGRVGKLLGWVAAGALSGLAWRGRGPLEVAVLKRAAQGCSSGAPACVQGRWARGVGRGAHARAGAAAAVRGTVAATVRLRRVLRPLPASPPQAAGQKG